MNWLDPQVADKLARETQDLKVVVAHPKVDVDDVRWTDLVALLTEAEYLALQELGEFDLKTSSWIATPSAIRGRGGALYAERRYGRVFVGHNGAQSYYAVRGFRGVVRV